MSETGQATITLHICSLSTFEAQLKKTTNYCRHRLHSNDEWRMNIEHLPCGAIAVSESSIGGDFCFYIDSVSQAEDGGAALLCQLDQRLERFFIRATIDSDFELRVLHYWFVAKSECLREIQVTLAEKTSALNRYPSS